MNVAKVVGVATFLVQLIGSLLTGILIAFACNVACSKFSDPAARAVSGLVVFMVCAMAFAYLHDVIVEAFQRRAARRRAGWTA
jgi:hypothetical protein